MTIILGMSGTDRARNNDKTLRIFSLDQMKSLASLHYPTRMNHASMSPNGEIILAVGDKPEVFFHRRVRFENTSVAGGKVFATYGWGSYAEHRLGPASTEDSCFTTSFSPTGRLCAVASQSGVIVIYNMERISMQANLDEAVVCALRTDRYSPWSEGSSAVRSLDFAPSPWDLLVWAEDGGQVSVLDLREQPIAKQTLRLSTEATAVHLAPVEMETSLLEQRQVEIESRFLESQRAALEAQDSLSMATALNPADYMDYIRPQGRQDRAESFTDSHRSRRVDLYQLTETEQSIINTIDQARRSSDHVSPVNGPVLPSTSRSLGADRTQAGSLYSTHVPTMSPRTVTGFDSDGHPVRRSAASVQDYMRQRNRDRSHTSERNHQPRRRTSIVISNSNTNHHNEAPVTVHPPHTSSLAPSNTTAVTLSASPSRLSSTSTSVLDATQSNLADLADQISSLTDNIRDESDVNHAWQIISDAFTSTVPDPTQPDNAGQDYRSAGTNRNSIESQASDVPHSVYTRLREQLGVRASPNLQALLQRNERQRAVNASNVQRLRQLQNAMAVQRRDIPPSLYETLGADSAIGASGPGGGLPIQGVGWSIDGRHL